MIRSPEYTRPAALLSAALFLLGACSSDRGIGAFSVALGAKLQTERPTEVDLSTVTPRPWEELFVFGPYTSRERNCEILQLGWFGCRATFSSAVNENEYTLVFRVAGKVIQSERHSRANGDFYSSAVPFPQPIRWSEARFTVLPISNSTPQGSQWFRLEYKGSTERLPRGGLTLPSSGLAFGKPLMSNGRFQSCGILSQYRSKSLKRRFVVQRM
jgi:hypothetical protein